MSRLERLLSSGAADPSFYQGAGPSGSVYHLAQGIDGSLWVGGNFFNYDGVSCRPVVNIAGGNSPYDLWVAGKFTSAQILSGVTDPTDDPDHDGIKNIAELALGSSPTVVNSTQQFGALAGSTGLVTSGAAQYLQTTFARGSSSSGVWLTAQFSSDLHNWQPSDPVPGNNSVYAVMEDSPSRFTVRDKTAAAAAPARFVRFSVSKPE